MNLVEQMRVIARRHSESAPLLPRRRCERGPVLVREEELAAEVEEGTERNARDAGCNIPKLNRTAARSGGNAPPSVPHSGDKGEPRRTSGRALLHAVNADGPEAHAPLNESSIRTSHFLNLEPQTLNPLSTGWSPVDDLLSGGLARGALHEWFGVTAGDEAARGEPWLPPLTILAHLAWRGVESCTAARWIVWVGRACFPYPRALLRGRWCDQRLLTRSIFVAPPDAYGRLWAIDLALRCPAVEGVLADGSEFDRVATQRVQFLARTRNKWALLTRPARELGKLSAAHSRWRVHWAGTGGPTNVVQPRWSVELLRCKGLAGESWRWELESEHVQGGVRLSTALADSTGAAGQKRRMAGGGVAG